jgi:hypothetical protein
MRFALMIRQKLAVFLAVAALALGSLGCPTNRPDEIGLYATTGAPPARTARFDERYPSRPVIEISAGVVLGLRCWDSCDGTCFRPDFTADNSALLEVLPTYRAGSASDGFVLTALKDGITSLVVANGCARQRYMVRVLKE